MAINFNTGPYFDDFDPANNFYRVLFKPGYAVQARELNQLQSILQHQMSTHANHIFKKNTVVVPGGVILNNTADIISIDNIADPSVLVGMTITNAQSFDYTDDSTLDAYITAVVLGYKSATSTEPAALYVKYFKTQTDGRATFQTSEVISTVGPMLIQFNVHSTVAPSVGKVATVAQGTYYTKELFVDVHNHSIIVEISNKTTTNCTIGLNITESIVTSDDDTTLLDNANGSPNQYAPGADRYKISLALTRVDPSITIDDDKFISLMKIENNQITYLNNKTEYADLMKMLARRTYDANGNFIVSGLETTLNPSTDDKFFWLNIGKGKCYLGGYEYNQTNDTPIAIEKPRDVAHQLDVAGTAKYPTSLSYFYVAGGSSSSGLMTEIPAENSLVQLLNAKPGTLNAKVIGYAVFKYMEYEFGTAAEDDVYKAYFDSITLEKDYSLSDIGGIKMILSSSEGMTVLHELKLSNIFGTFTPGNDITSGTDSTQTGLIYESIGNYVYVIKNTLNKIPNTETVADVTASATATLSSSFVTNYTPDIVPLIEVDASTIKTLYNADGDITTEYSFVRTDSYSITSSASTITSNALNSYETFASKSAANFFAYIVISSGSGSDQIYNLMSGNTLTLTPTSYTIDIPALTIPSGSTAKLWVYSTVNKTPITQANKTLQTATINISTPSAAWMALGHTDVVKIIKIADSGNSSVDANIDTDNDITSRYIVDTGNNKYTSGTGLIKLRKRAVAPTGRIAVKYQYYSTASSTGGYVSVDSYGVYNNVNNDLSYIGEIKDIDKGNGSKIQVRRYLDFRTKTSNYFFKNIGYIANGTNVLFLKDLNLSYYATTLVGKYIVGPSHLNGVTITAVNYDTASGSTKLTLNSNAAATLTGIYYIGLKDVTSGGVPDLTIADSTAGARTFSFPKQSEIMSVGYTKFLPKKVLAYIDRKLDIMEVKYEEVTSIDAANDIRRNENKLPLVFLEMNPYTVSVQDLKLTKFENPVYQMIDIHGLKERIDTTEYYASLALNRDLHTEVALAAQETLTESSMGFWNEDFMAMSTQDFDSDDFVCTVYDKSYVSPGVVTKTIALELDTSNKPTTWTRTGTTTSLPFTEMTLLSNGKASRSYNLNPYNVINWSSGKLTLTPSVDNWIDVTADPVARQVTTIQTNINDLVDVRPPPSLEHPPLVEPPPPPVEIVTQINNLRVNWGPDTAGGSHAIAFDWVTNFGRTGRVNNDIHKSRVIGQYGFNGTYARSLINKKYNDSGVKEYLNAGNIGIVR